MRTTLCGLPRHTEQSVTAMGQCQAHWRGRACVGAAVLSGVEPGSNMLRGWIIAAHRHRRVCIRAHMCGTLARGTPVCSASACEGTTHRLRGCKPSHRLCGPAQVMPSLQLQRRGQGEGPTALRAHTANPARCPQRAGVWGHDTCAVPRGTTVCRIDGALPPTANEAHIPAKGTPRQLPHSLCLCGDVVCR